MLFFQYQDYLSELLPCDWKTKSHFWGSISADTYVFWGLFSGICKWLLVVSLIRAVFLPCLYAQQRNSSLAVLSTNPCRHIKGGIWAVMWKCSSKGKSGLCFLCSASLVSVFLQDGRVFIWTCDDASGNSWSPKLLHKFNDVVWHVSWSITANILAVSGGDNKVSTDCCLGFSPCALFPEELTWDRLLSCV